MCIPIESNNPSTNLALEARTAARKAVEAKVPASKAGASNKAPPVPKVGE